MYQNLFLIFTVSTVVCSVDTRRDTGKVYSNVYPSISPRFWFPYSTTHNDTRHNEKSNTPINSSRRLTLLWRWLPLDTLSFSLLYVSPYYSNLCIYRFLGFEDSPSFRLINWGINLVIQLTFTTNSLNLLYCHSV